jgi:23S rRNA (cytosine1962-C5)-methyltransferase
MKPGHNWLGQRAKDKKILNLFAYTCAFSVVAKASGAQSVLNVDMNKQALAIGRQNHQRNDLPLSGVEFLPYDVFKSIGKLKKWGPYDIVICDPPSYQKGSFVAKKDYSRLAKHFNALVKPEGELLICLNSPDLDTRFIAEFMAEFAPNLYFVNRLENAPDFPELNLEKGLKLMVYRNSLDNSSS